MTYDPTRPFSRFGTAPTSPPDPRDFMARAFLAGRVSAAGLPDEVGAGLDLAPPIRCQCQEGSCTGHAFRTVKHIVEARQRAKWRRKFLPEFGPRGIYQLAKTEGGYPHEEGAYMRDVCKAAAKAGVPREKDWPYVPHTSDEGVTQDIGTPSKRWLTNAARWKIGAYAKATTLDEMLVSLHQHGALFIAMDLHDNFFSTGKDGEVPSPVGPVVGAHAMAFVGAVQSERKFKTANSWGLDFGEDGYCDISFDHFMSVDSEAWTIPDAP